MLSESNYNALIEFRTENEVGPVMNEHVRYFRDCGYIRGTTHEMKSCPGHTYMNPVAWIITPRGEDALSEFEYRTQKDAEENSEKKQDRVFEVLLVLFGALVGLLIEHFSGVAGWIASLF